jgi:hypothetical protein
MSNFENWQERDAFYEKYGEFYAGLLDETLGFIKDVGNHQHSENEARTKLLARFEELMHEHVPATHEPVAKYLARVAAERQAETDAAVAYHERQHLVRAAYEHQQRERAEAKELALRASIEKEQRAQEEFRDKFEAEARAIQTKRDLEQAEESSKFERLLQKIGFGKKESTDVNLEKEG